MIHDHAELSDEHGNGMPRVRTKVFIVTRLAFFVIVLRRYVVCG